MSTVTKFHPSVRQDLRHMMRTGFTAFFTSMQKESFSEPDTAETISILLEAVADSAADLVGDHPDRQALLKTFSIEVLDKVEV